MTEIQRLLPDSARILTGILTVLYNPFLVHLSIYIPFQKVTIICIIQSIIRDSMPNDNSWRKKGGMTAVAGIPHFQNANIGVVAWPEQQLRRMGFNSQILIARLYKSDFNSQTL